ncbi:hypothetical protein H920_04367 [Fukomys damarensis]|uniref:Uncharacterized protein n=1 Tax=Fukomys damarensis TaxID=885580 RepID=A0A091DUV2_FUKDA|nr:hypothetical protein H920_04367 [Fukomys damarensis]
MPQIRHHCPRLHEGGEQSGPSGMRRSPDVSPRRLSDISPQLRQLKYLVVDEAIKEDLKWSRSVEDLTSGPVGLTSIEERILRITGYYGYQPWAASYKTHSMSLEAWWSSYKEVWAFGPSVEHQDIQAVALGEVVLRLNAVAIVRSKGHILAL